MLAQNSTIGPRLAALVRKAEVILALEVVVIE